MDNLHKKVKDDVKNLSSLSSLVWFDPTNLCISGCSYSVGSLCLKQ
jgi:hypothetical protein